jgi:hypothetical protein
VPAQERQLGLNDTLVLVQERCVVLAGQTEQLGTGRAPRGTDGRLGERGLVLVAHEDQQRAPDAGGEAAGPVERQAQRRAGGRRRGPVRVAVVRVERAVGVEGIRGSEHRHGARPGDERHQQGRAADQTAEGVAEAPEGDAQHRRRPLMGSRVARGGQVADARRLRDRRRQVGVGVDQLDLGSGPGETRQ